MTDVVKDQNAVLRRFKVKIGLDVNDDKRRLAMVRREVGDDKIVVIKCLS